MNKTWQIWLASREKAPFSRIQISIGITGLSQPIISFMAEINWRFHPAKRVDFRAFIWYNLPIQTRKSEAITKSRGYLSMDAVSISRVASLVKPVAADGDT